MLMKRILIGISTIVIQYQFNSDQQSKPIDGFFPDWCLLILIQIESPLSKISTEKIQKIEQPKSCQNIYICYIYTFNAFISTDLFWINSVQKTTP